MNSSLVVCLSVSTGKSVLEGVFFCRCRVGFEDVSYEAVLIGHECLLGIHECRDHRIMCVLRYWRIRGIRVFGGIGEVCDAIDASV